MPYRLLRKLLFYLDPETAHHLSLNLLNITSCLYSKKHYIKPCSVMGLDFPNPIGLSAGLDKNADFLSGLGKLGFGFIEVGTVTPKPQIGNPKPRMFRIPEQQAVINCLGFNNKGVDYLVKKIANRRYDCILGVNIGKNRDTPLENAVDDYRFCLDKVYRYADYVTINISSPNTPDLRQLQQQDHLSELLQELKTKQLDLAQEYGRYVPLAVKIAPDLNDEALAQMVEQFVATEIDAVIATNTSNNLSLISEQLLGKKTGGVSGAPLLESSTKILSRLNELLAQRIPIIGVGGVMSGDDARQKFAAGASLIQIYTGLVYQGPGLVKDIFAKL